MNVFAACPKGTYGEGNVPGDVSTCQSCPDRNQNTKKYPATSLNDCICKEGFVPGNLKCEGEQFLPKFYIEKYQC